MEGLIRKNLYWILLLTVILQANAQKSHIRSQGYWTLGLNGGWAYQQSDAEASFDGRGFGLTLAKNLWYKPGAPLTFDLRGRFLYANTYGIDGNPSFGITNNTAINGSNGIDYITEPGYVFYNHNTKIGELALEGVFHLNRLRERSKFDVSIFGGVGLDYYNTKNNWLNADGTYATAFSEINLNGNARNQVVNILDDSFETKADGFQNGGKINVMPALGAELYYWFTPKFGLGLGHKATWARADNLDGQQWDSDNNLTAENDLYHYTHFGAKWIIEPGRRTVQEPFITITDPQMNPFPSPTPEGYVRATIENAKADQVRCQVNGRNARFNMNGENFRISFPLREGRNEVVITATNSAGRAQETQIITYDEVYTPPVVTTTPPSGDLPYVRFINPPSNNYNVSNSNFTIEATIDNVASSGDVQVLLNGKRLRNFDFRRNKVTAPVTLVNGKNSISIRVRNNQGQATEEAFVYYETANTQTQQQPSVVITRPSANPYTTDNSSARVEATVKNVNSRDNISVYISGRRSNNFEYDTRTGRLTSTINLNEGENKVYIEAKANGNASDQVTIIYKDTTPPPPPPAVEQKPVVRITATGNPVPNDCRTTIKATVKNVDSFRDIAFMVNGQRVTNFEYNPSTARFQSTINLRQGQNNILIEAGNRAGRGSDSATVNCSGSIISNDDTPTNNNAKPIVTITTPSSQSTTTKESRATIKATVKNIDAKNDIAFMVNGQRVTNFTYSTSTKKFQATVNLKTGNNDIVIKAGNKFGRGEDGVGIRYISGVGTATLPKPPIVTITKPSNNATVTTAKTQVKASIKNMPSKNGISLLVNGRGISDFSYSGGNLSANVSLKAGNNTIQIKAVNSDGQDQAGVSVRYNVPAAKPEVNFTSPKNNAIVETMRQQIKATVKNAKKSDLTFTMNGSRITNFTLNGTNFLATVNLNKGQNKLQLKAATASGSDTDNLTIVFNSKPPVPKPVVAFTNPARPGKVVSEPSAKITATVKNVADKRGIVFKLNGTSVKGFQSNPASSTVTASVNLKEGKNTLQIVATNDAGSTTANSSITYKKAAPVATPPTVKIESASQPTVNPMNPGVGRSSIVATIKNVTNSNAITLTVNGKKITNFEFKPRSNTLKAVVDLERGTNKIVIKASNQDGVAQDSKTVSF